ncbi:MAG: hypothetical protein BGO26_13195 [Actinobacteria bacterium 69-20]|nr:MAG: hypothetical protein BGO26_13195 [Actinobacteria bacterium 69-20]
MDSRRSLSDDVYDHMVEFVLTAGLAPDTHINVDSLARAWHVSQTPIREALVRAEEAGLVTREPLRGFRIAPVLSSAEFSQLMHLRILIEPYSAAEASKSTDVTLIPTLEAHMAIMRQARNKPGAQEFSAYMRADREFHDAIAAASGNRFVRLALSTTAVHAHRFRLFASGRVDDASETVAEHSAVVDALRVRNADAASTAMYRHLVSVAERVYADFGPPRLAPVPQRQMS